VVSWELSSVMLYGGIKFAYGNLENVSLASICREWLPLAADALD